LVFPKFGFSKVHAPVFPKFGFSKVHAPVSRRDGRFNFYFYFFKESSSRAGFFYKTTQNAILILCNATNTYIHPHNATQSNASFIKVIDALIKVNRRFRAAISRRSVASVETCSSRCESVVIVRQSFVRRPRTLHDACARRVRAARATKFDSFFSNP